MKQSLETVAHQAQSTARNLVNNAAASVRRQTSITAWANRLIVGAAKKVPSVHRRREEGVYILSSEDVRKGRHTDGQPFVTPDGYLRRTPVQEIVVDPGYRRRLLRRVLFTAAGIAAAGLILYALIRLGFLAF